MSHLVCLLYGREVGRVTRMRGRLSFGYARSWRDARGAYPLSLSMPLVAKTHSHGAIEPFLWGLLPDNDLVLRRWAASFHVSPGNVFGILAEVGEDCAGAVQFMSPERFEALQAETAPRVDWISEADVAARLGRVGRAPGPKRRGASGASTGPVARSPWRRARGPQMSPWSPIRPCTPRWAR